MSSSDGCSNKSQSSIYVNIKKKEARELFVNIELRTGILILIPFAKIHPQYQSSNKRPNTSAFFNSNSICKIWILIFDFRIAKL